MPKITKDWYDPAVVAAFNAKMANGGVAPARQKIQRRSKAEIKEAQISSQATPEAIDNRTRGEKIDELHAMKWSRQRIALHLNIPVNVVKNRIEGQRKKKRDAIRFAQEREAKLRPTAQEILADRAKGMSCGEVAEKHGVEVELIYKRLRAYRNRKAREAEVAEFGETSH